MNSSLNTQLLALAQNHPDCLILHSLIIAAHGPRVDASMGHAIHADDEITELNVIKRVKLLVGAKLAYETAVQSAATWMHVPVPALKTQIEHAERTSKLNTQDL